MTTSSVFDVARAEERLRRGLAATAASTQSWGVEEWTGDWLDEDGRLHPGSLGEAGGAWWYRALTAAERLRGEVPVSTTDPMTQEEARERFELFCRVATRELRYWPIEAMAPVAFCLRESLGVEPSLAFVDAQIPPAARHEYLRWLGPLPAERARELIAWSDHPRDVAALAESSDLAGGVRRLLELDAEGELRRLLERPAGDERATFEVDLLIHTASKRKSRAQRAALDALRERPRSLVEERLSELDEERRSRVCDLLTDESPPSETLWGHRRGELAAKLLAIPIGVLEAWDIARLDDLSRNGAALESRVRARKLLEAAADEAGVVVSRFVEDRLPHESSPLLETIASERLELAMCEGRLMTEWSWRRLVGRDPFPEVASRLVWAAIDGGEQRRCFRWVDEEALDLSDAAIELEHATIAVVHPAELDDSERRSWNERFAEYEIVQPFDQLERPSFRVDSLSRDGFVSPVGRKLRGEDIVSHLQQAGWNVLRTGAHGRIEGMKKDGRGVQCSVRFEPRLDSNARGITVITRIECDVGAPAPFFSEAHLDLHRLGGSG